MTRQFLVPLAAGTVAMTLEDAGEGMRLLRWPGRDRFEMIFAPSETEQDIAREAAAYVADADQVSPGHFRRDGGACATGETA